MNAQPDIETPMVLDGETLAEAFGRIMASTMHDDAKQAAFIALCMGDNYRRYADMTQPLIAQYQQRVGELERELAGVRRRIRLALSGHAMPTPAYLLECLQGEPRVPLPRGPE